MGFSISWIAVQTSDAGRVYEALNLKRTGVMEEIPESPVVGASLPGGWTLIVTDDVNSPLLDLASGILPKQYRVITCQIEEHAMASFAVEHGNSNEGWDVMHVASNGRDHLDASGSLPAVFNDVLAELKQRQDDAAGEESGVDYMFEVPIELAYRLTSFRHDQSIAGASPTPFEVLEPANSPASITTSETEEHARRKAPPPEPKDEIFNPDAVSLDFATLITGWLITEDGIHWGNAISAGARMAGTFLFRSFELPDLKAEPGNIILSAAANEQGPVLLETVKNTLKVLHGITLESTRLTHDIPHEYRPTLSIAAVQEKLEPTFRTGMSHHGLTNRQAAYVCAVATAHLIYMATKIKDFDPHVGFSIAAFGCIEGTKTIPVPLLVPSKKPWYKFW
jgi:hypothetical protein